MKQRAVFIDRDGTLSEEVGYINHPSRFSLFPYAAPAIRYLNENGWLAIVITNQAGVARGYFSEDMIQTVHERMERELESNGAKLDAIYYCAHHPSVGERYSDIELARNAGLKSMFVLSGYGRGEWEHQRASWIEKPDLVTENLLQAVRQIVSDSLKCADLSVPC